MCKFNIVCLLAAVVLVGPVGAWPGPPTPDNCTTVCQPRQIFYDYGVGDIVKRFMHGHCNGCFLGRCRPDPEPWPAVCASFGFANHQWIHPGIPVIPFRIR
jgi:hypothetical protein